MFERNNSNLPMAKKAMKRKTTTALIDLPSIACEVAVCAVSLNDESIHCVCHSLYNEGTMYIWLNCNMLDFTAEIFIFKESRNGIYHVLRGRDFTFRE